MKKCNIHYIGGDIFVLKCHYLWPSNSLLRQYNQFGNLTLSFALFWSLKKNFNYQIVCRVTYVTGYKQLNAAIVRGLTCCKILARHWALRKCGLQNSLGEVNHIRWPNMNLFRPWQKTSAKFQKDLAKIAGGVAFTIYPVSIYFGRSWAKID